MKKADGTQGRTSRDPAGTIDRIWQETIAHFPAVDSKHLDKVNDLVQAVNEEGKITYANQKWLEALGYSKEDLPGLDLEATIRADELPHFHAMLRSVMSGEKLDLIETVFRTRDGRDIHVEGNIRGYFKDGRFMSTLGVFRDVSRRKMAEEIYNLLVLNSPLPVYIVQDGAFRFVNASLLNLIGYSESELMGKDPLAFVHPQDKEYVRKSAIRILKSRPSANYEFRIIRKDGEVRWVMETVMSIPYEGGRATLGTVVDLTERRMVESALQEARDRYQTIFNSVKDAIYIVDMQNRILEVNDAACSLLGYSRSEFLKNANAEYYLLPTNRKEIGETGYFNGESEIVTRSGKRMPVEYFSHYIEYEKHKAILTVVRDVSERRLIENNRKRNQARLESLVRLSQFKPGHVRDLLSFTLEEVIRLTGSQIGFLYFYHADRGEFSLHSWSKELMGTNSLKKLQSTFKPEQGGILAEVISQGQPLLVNQSQNPGLTTNGYPEGTCTLGKSLVVPVTFGREITAVVSAANKEMDYDQVDIQQVTSLLAAVWNILERWKAEEAMRESEQRYRQLIDLSQDAILRMDANGIIHMANPAACQMFGYTAEELEQSSFEKTFLPEERSAATQHLAGLQDGKPLRIERLAIRKDGSRFPIEVSISPLTQGYFQEMIRDITNRKKAEERLNYQAMLIDNVSDAIYSTDLKSRILSWNKGAEKTFGWSREEAIGKKIQDMLMPDNAEGDIEGLVDLVLKTGSVQAELVQRRKDGSQVILLALTSLIKDAGGKAIGLINVSRDITERKKAEEQLEYQAMLIDNVSDAIYSTDLNSRILSWNKGAEKIFGWSQAEAKSKGIQDILMPDSVTGDVNELVELILKKGSIQMEVVQRRKDGSPINMLALTSVIRDAGGKVVGLINVSRDITERKKMEKALAESEKKYKLLVENQTDIIAEMNNVGQLVFVNPAYCQLLGKTKEELLGTKIESQIHEDDREHSRKEILPVLKPPHQTVYLENRVLTKDGWRWIAWTDNAVLDEKGTATGTTCLGRDITESKLAKEELEKANEQLRELDRLKDNFLSTVSHELRTPLTSIKSFAEILLNYDEDRATQKEFLGIINDESDRLTRLINDFLDLSKIQAGRMQWQTVELSMEEAIRAATNATRPLIEKAKLELITFVEADMPHVMSDKDRLIQVVTNILGNAIKFTPENGKITLRAWSDKKSESEKGDFVTVSITDTGIGIAPENHQKIFEKFGQVGDVLKDRARGTGLGLPICKKIVENYGGRIWVQSALGQGTTFFFTLPAVKQNSRVESLPGGDAAAQEIHSLSGKTILVVDDEANIRRFLRHELSSRGHHVIEAASGKEGVDLARQHHPDLITLDISMPDLNGFDVTAVLKNDPETKNIPIFIVSVIEDKQKAYRLGADDYITKPVDTDSLIDKVNRLLWAGEKK